MIQESNKLTDIEVIGRILKGDKALYEIIVKRYNAYLYKVGRSYNYNHDDTQDLMQETYIDAYRNLSQFENRSSFKTWIVKIMLNNCHKKKQKLSFKNEFSEDLLEDNAVPMFSNDNKDTTRVILQHELKHLIEESLTKLPHDYRVVFGLREINQLSVADTAQLLNLTESNVKVRLNRAKTMLKKELSHYYSPTDLYEFHLVHCDAMLERVIKNI